MEEYTTIYGSESLGSIDQLKALEGEALKVNVSLKEN